MRIHLKLLAASAILVLTSYGAAAQSVRVTTWDLSGVGNDEKSPAFDRAAQQIKSLSPDVILLRGVTGWKICSQLSKALKPADYRVITCSAFGQDAGAAKAQTQVAILARTNAYFAWSEPWKAEGGTSRAGGFAFAAIQIAGHRFGFSTLELSKRGEAATLPAIGQWLETLDSYRAWANNRLEGFVAATFASVPTDGETGRLLRGAGFADPLSGAAPRATGEVVQGHLLPNASSPNGLLLAGGVTCDFDFNPASVVVVTIPSPLPTQTNPPSLVSTVTPARLDTVASSWWLGGALALVLIAIVSMLLGIRRKLARLQAQSALVPVSSNSYNVVIAPPADSTSAIGTVQSLATPASSAQDDVLRQGLFTHLSDWIKQVFVQRLLSDRQKLLTDQNTATMKVLAVDERLARLEAKIRKETARYERQIEELSRELLTAREENLELIRGQIKLLKSEMEATRARLLESEAL